MFTQPGYVLLKDGSTKAFRAKGHKSALKAVMDLLDLRALTRKALKKAHAVAIFFGLKSCQIYPFRQHRMREERAGKMRNRERLEPPHKDGLDIGRRRHYNPLVRNFFSNQSPLAV